VLFDELVEFKERQFKTLGERPAQGRFAGATEADEGNPPMMRGRINSAEMVEQKPVGDHQILGRQLPQELHGWKEFPRRFSTIQ